MIQTKSHGVFKAGRYFLHSKWIEADNGPQRCKVTKIDGDEIYYQAVYFDQQGAETYSKTAYFKVNEIPKYVL